MELVTSLADVLTLVALAVFFVLLLVALFIAYMDSHQRSHAILRNYPFLGRFRYWLEKLGEFLRHYFFAQDREELPFNRAQRAWAYRAAKNVDNTLAFGSTKDLNRPGEFIFLNDGFPWQEAQRHLTQTLQMGPYCRKPYTPGSFYNISAMSYGALSKNAVLALSRGAKKANCWLNTGEGGLSSHHLSGGCDIVFQIGTAKYGVRNEQGGLDEGKLREIAALEQVKMFEIKLSQGAKPGKGGILPGAKVTEEIAIIRGIPAGKDSISPNRHPEIDSPDALADMIDRVRELTGKPVGIKFVLGSTQWLKDFLNVIVQRGIQSAPDYITLDSGDGGSGAAPMPLMDSVGLPLKDSLPILDNLLREKGLRDRIRIIASGKLMVPSNVAAALCMGADFCVSARGFMLSLGCIQAFQCNKNTCPTGVTTHNPRLQKGLVPEEKAERVFHYQQNMLKEVAMIAHSCGVEEPRKLQRQHAKVVQEGGKLISLEELFPYPETGGDVSGNGRISS